MRHLDTARLAVDSPVERATRPAVSGTHAEAQTHGTTRDPWRRRGGDPVFGGTSCLAVYRLTPKRWPWRIRRRCRNEPTRPDASPDPGHALCGPIWVVSPVVRPWHMRWGAMDAEVAGPMPGDHVVPRAQFNAKVPHHRRAARTGVAVDRAARLPARWLFTPTTRSTTGEPSADRIIDEFQDLKVGDLILMWHESHGLAIAYKVDSLEVPRWMLWCIDRTEEPDSAWSWRLDELATGGARLVTRVKQDYRWETPGVGAVRPGPDGVRRIRDGKEDAEGNQGSSRAAMPSNLSCPFPRMRAIAALRSLDRAMIIATTLGPVPGLWPSEELLRHHQRDPHQLTENVFAL
jgi:hypothetical protein